MKKVQITLAVLMLCTLAFTNVNAQSTDTGGQTNSTTETSSDDYEDDDSDYGAWGLLGLLGLAGLIPRKDKLVNHNTNNPSR